MSQLHGTQEGITFGELKIQRGSNVVGITFQFFTPRATNPARQVPKEGVIYRILDIDGHATSIQGNVPQHLGPETEIYLCN